MSVKIFCICLFFATVALLSPCYGDTNLLTNPGFETGTTTGWIARSCTIGTVTSPVHDGSYSARVYNRTQTWQGIQQSIMGLISDGQSCYISGWIRLENASSDSVAITVKQTDDGGAHYHPIQWSTGRDDIWTYLSGNFTLDVNGTLTGLDLYFEGPQSGVNFFVDDVTLIGPEPDPNHAIGQIDAVIRHQEIEGFGASGAWYENWLVAHPQKNEIYDIIFGQLGLDIYRIRNTYDIDQSNIDKSAEIIAQGEASLGRDLKIMISSWSPPAYLKSDANTVNGTLVKDSNGNYKYEEFAQWWLESLIAYEANGIVAEYVNMQNEPDCLPDWDSCRFRPTETIDWAGYNLAFDALANKLKTMQNPPKLLAPETCNISRELNNHYLDKIIDSNQLYGYAHHLYGDGNSLNPDSYIPNMTNFAARYNDKPILQTEYHFGREDFAAAMDLAEIMHNSLAVEGVSAYLHWQLFWGGSMGLVTLDNPWQPDPNYTINPIYYAFKHYSAFIHSGWRRLEASIDSTSPRISAYISPDNQQLTVVLINTYTDNDVNLDLSFNNFSVEDGNVYRTSSMQNCVPAGDFNDSEPLILPAQSITTLALTGTLLPANCQEVQDFGHRLLADLDSDCYVNFEDLLIMTEHWLETAPITVFPPEHSPDVHPGPDNIVNLLDFAELAAQWLTCNDPLAMGCVSNW